jgi:hypothetical protein
MDYKARSKLAKKLWDRATDRAFELGYGDEGAWRRVRRLSNACLHYEDRIRGLPRKPHKLVVNVIYQPLNPDGTTSKWHRMGCAWSEAKWTESGRKRFFEKYGEYL